METISLESEKKEETTPFRKNKEHNAGGGDNDDLTEVSFQGSSGGQSLEIDMEGHEERFTILSWFCCCRSRRNNGTSFEQVRLGKEHRHSREKQRKKEETGGDGDGESILRVSNGLKSGFS